MIFMLVGDYKKTKILIFTSIASLLLFFSFSPITGGASDNEPMLMSVPSPRCYLIWDAPVDANSDGLRKIGEFDNVFIKVAGLNSNQEFTLKNFHNSSDFTKTGGTQSVDSSGFWSAYDHTQILDSEYGDHLGVYTTKIVDSAGSVIAVCGGFTLIEDILPPPVMPSCSLIWDDPKDGDGNGLRKIGEFDNVTFNVSGLAPNQSFAIKNFHNSSDFTKTSDAQIADGYGAWNLYDHTQILDSEYGDHLGVYTTKIVDVSGFPIVTCGSFTLSKDVPPPPVNTPPTISLIGSDPLNLNIGAIFIDPGANATDAEDGNLTAQIVAGGTVNTSIVGSYTRTYSIVDSGGLTASTNRTVIVSEVVPPTNFNIYVSASKIVCDNESDLPNWGVSSPNITEATASQFLNSHTSCRAVSDWQFQWASSTATDPGSKFIGEAPGWHTFGPTNTFGVATTTISVSSTTPRVWFREVLRANYLGFSTVTENNPYSAEMYCNTDVLNYDNYDLIANPFVSGATYHCIAFNVLDSVIPPVNTPPVITLVGANPFNISVGNTFIDPGATSTDVEDGDLTSQVVRTGTVNTTLAGSYTLTYVVRDSGNLYATTTRTVVVNPSGCTSNCGEDHQPTVSLSSNPGAIILGATSTLSWTSTNANFCSAIWTSATSTNGSQIVSPLLTTSYVITCVGSAGSSTATTTVTVSSSTPRVNTPPVITLVGTNPFNITSGDVFTDPGATASDLEDGDATTTAHIIVSGAVNTSVAGSYILTYSVTDSGGLSASTTRTVIVSEKSNPPTPPETPPRGGGGGHRHPVVVGEILGATSCLYLRDYLKIDWKNDPVEVLKLQSFLNVFEKENLSFTGKFDQATFAAVQRFQTKYAKDILNPWGDKVTTGFVYILTKKKINEIYCNTILDLSADDKSEIETFRTSGVNVFGEVGRTDIQGQNKGQNSYFDISEYYDDVDTEAPIVDLVSGSSTDDSILKNAAISLFVALPQKIFSDWRYLALFLVLIVVVVTLVRIFGKSNTDQDDHDGPISSVPKEDVPTSTSVLNNQESPVIALPGFNKEKSSDKKMDNMEEILPDEEIIVENPEEGLEEITIASTELKNRNEK